jgi:hypothetical protein
VNIRQLKPYTGQNRNITDASKARKAIDEVMKEFNSIVQYRRPITEDDFMTDEEIDFVLNQE